MTQQEQARHYFRSAAADWQDKAVNTAGYSVIDARNRAVLDVVVRSGNAVRFLDVGCGTGLMLDELAPRGQAIGVDVSPTALAFCRLRSAIRR